MSAVNHIFKKAVDLHSRGDFQQAEKLYKKILKSHPQHPDILHLLGLTAFQTGKYKSAVESFERAIAINPGNPDFYNDCGEAWRALHDYESAIRCYEKALTLNPGLAEAHNNLGIVNKTLDNPEEAISHYKQAISLNPGYAEAHYNLAYLLQNQGLFKESIEHYEQVLFLKPDFAETHNNLGNIFKDMERLDKALDHYKQAIHIKPDFAEVYVNMGAVFKAQNCIDEAINCYEQAIRQNTELASAYYNIGELYERTNQLDKAKYYVEKLIQLFPDDPYGRRLVATLLRRDGKYEEAIQQLIDIDCSEIPVDAAQDIQFEIGQNYDQLNEPEKAFNHFTDGNRLQAAGLVTVNYDKNSFLKEIDNLQDLFAELSMDTHLPKGGAIEDRQTPVFMVGFPRSGTTLLDQILDSHKQIHVIEEKPALENVTNTISESFGDYPDSLRSLGSTDIKMLQSEYFKNLDPYLDKNTKEIIIDKFPLNIIHIGLINILFPGAKIILVIRHPLDVCLSCFMQPFKANAAMINFFNIEDTSVLYDRVMKLWQCYEQLLQFDFHIVKYESLVDDMHAETGKLLDFLGLDWDPAVLDYAEHARSRGSISTPSYSQVTRPVYKSSIHRWQRYRQQLEPVITKLQPHIKKFGYVM